MLRATAIFIGAGLLAWGCSSLSASSDQCKVDSDCEPILGLAPGQAICELGQCSRKGQITPGTDDAGSTVAACVSTDQCTTDLGSPAVCLKPGVDPCIKLTSPECPEVSPNFNKGNPVFVGVLTDTTVVQGGVETDNAYDQTVSNGAKLALEEWDTQTGGGITSGTVRRPIVGIFCNGKLTPSTREAAYDHLSKRVGVQAVVVRSTDMANAIAARSTAEDRLLYCTDCESAATAVGISTKGLVWHQSPSALLDIPARVDWASRTERRIRAQRELASSTQLKAVFLSITDSGYSEWTAASVAALRINGKTAAENGDNFVRIARPSSDTDGIKLAREIVALQPDLVIGSGYGTYWHQQVMPAIEAYWPANVPRPHYIMGTDEVAYADRWRYSVGSNDNLRARFQGTWLADEPLDYAAYDEFDANYKARFSASSQGITNGYDAMQVLGYAIAGAVSAPTTVQDRLAGSDIARQFQRLVPGTDDGTPRPLTLVRPSSIKNGLSLLAAGKGLDLQGCLSNLDWNPTTGLILANVETYCGVRDPETRIVHPNDTGIVYHTRTGKFVSNDDESVEIPASHLGDEDVYPECF